MDDSLLGYERWCVIDMDHSLLGYERCRGATGDDGDEVFPATLDTPGVPLDQLSQRNGHLFLHGTRVVHLAWDVEQLKHRHTWYMWQIMWEADWIHDVTDHVRGWLNTQCDRSCYRLNKYMTWQIMLPAHQIHGVTGSLNAWHDRSCDQLTEYMMWQIMLPAHQIHGVTGSLNAWCDRSCDRLTECMMWHIMWQAHWMHDVKTYLGAPVSLPTKACKPLPSTTTDRLK